LFVRKVGNTGLEPCEDEHDSIFYYEP